MQAKGCKIAIQSFPVVDVGENKLWNNFSGKEESNVDAIFEGSCEEGVREELARVALDFAGLS
jgi:hypothetical protein